MAYTDIVGPKSWTPTPLANATYYVSPTGSGVGTIGDPMSIASAISAMSAGDVVFLRGGTYPVSSNIVFSANGSSGNPIIIENYPGETAIFDGSQHAKGTNIWLKINGNFVHFRGIHVRNMPREGIFIQGSDNLIQGCETYNNALDAIKTFSPVHPYGQYGSRNVIRDCISHDNSDVGSFPGSANGGNADGVALTSGIDNRVENCLIYGNSDNGISAFHAENAYIGYNIVHTTGLGQGDGVGIKSGGSFPSDGYVVEYNVVYGSRLYGIDHNTGDNQIFRNNTTWNNAIGFTFGNQGDVTAYNNISLDTTKKIGTGISETNNSWQRTGTVAFISTDPNNANFLVPTVGGGFEDIGAFAGSTQSLLPDVIVTALSYNQNTGVFSATIENQGTADTPAGITVAVGYYVDGVYRTWGGITGTLAAGQSTNVGTKAGLEYFIPNGSHTITAWADDVNRFTELDESNNQFSTNIFVGSTSPTVSITSPANNSVITADSVTISADATDDVGIASVQFKLDGSNIGNAVTSAPYQIIWDSTSVVDGSYTITAVATDTDTNQTTSSGINITVQHPAAQLLPDVFVNDVSYSNGIFTSTVENRGNTATPSGISVVVKYLVDGIEKTWGAAVGELSVGQIKTVGTNGSSYQIPDGVHTITAWIDSDNLFAESNENNNQLSKTITVFSGADVTPLPYSTTPITASIDLSNSETLPSQLQLFYTQFKNLIPQINSQVALLDLDDYYSLSSTSNVISKTELTFTVDSGKLFKPGMMLMIADNAAPSTNYMIGMVKSYSSTTLIINTIIAEGSGTLTDWVISFNAPVQPFVGDNEVIVYGNNGTGSTNTAISRFTTIYKNAGTAITYADSAANGASFTINEKGLYGISYVDGNSTFLIHFGISLNSSELTTNIESITVSDRLVMSEQVVSNQYVPNFVTKELEVGDIVRPHRSSSGVSLTQGRFSVTKIKALQ